MSLFRFHRDELLRQFRARFRQFHGPLNLERGKRTNENFLKLISCIEADPAWNNLREISYLISTVYHETGHDFEPREEYGKGYGKRYGAQVFLNRHQTVAFYGRGWCQLTWLGNYVKASFVCGVDFISNPDLVMRFPHCYTIISDGMRRGWFTGHSLGDFITPTKTDYVGARRIINGQDKAALIAQYATEFAILLTAHQAKEI
jgi:hypothetical protein